MFAEMPVPNGLASWVPARVREHAPVVSLRDYQTDAVHHVSHAIGLRDKRRVVVVMATGGGKTVVFGALAHAWLADGMGRVLVLAHRDELITQAVAKMSLWIPRHLIGIVKAEQNAISAPVVVASVQTLRIERRLEQVGHFGLIVIDEAHHAAAQSYRDILSRLGAFSEGGPAVVGVTATPKRGDGAGIDDVFEEIVYRKTYTDLVAKGWLVPPRGIAFDLIVREKPQLGIDKDYQEGWLGRMMLKANAPSKILEAWTEHAEDRPTIVFTPTVSVAKAVAETFNGGGIPSAWVSGAMPLSERRAALEGLRTQTIKVVANCLDEQTEILSERGWVGIDTILPDDRTATVNKETGAFEWQPISRVVQRDREPDERMVRIKNQSLDIRVTEGHRMVVRAHGAHTWSVVEAGSLPSRRGAYCLPLSGLHAADGVPLGEWELKFLGLFATDGSLNVKRASIEIAQSATSATCAAIEEILTNCQFDWKVTARIGKTPAGEDRPYRIYRIPKGNIGGQLSRRGWGRLSGWIDKSLSPRLEACTASQFLHLVFGLWLGDGLKHHTGKREAPSPTICGIDRVMFDRLQAWAAGLGFATSLSWQPNGASLLGYLRIMSKTSIGTNNHTIPTSGGNPAQFESDWKPERVWCVTNENGTIVTRRNGRVVVTGQCAVLTEGFDEPSVSCIVVARPTKNESLYIQMVGRGTRCIGQDIHESRANGKKDVLIMDMVGCSDQLQLDAIVELVGRKASATSSGAVREEALPGTAGDVPFEVADGALVARTFKTHRPICRWVELPTAWYALSLLSDGWVTVEPDGNGTWSVVHRPKRGKKSVEYEDLTVDLAKSVGESVAREKSSRSGLPMFQRAGWLDRPVSEKSLAYGLSTGLPITATTTAWEKTVLEAEREYCTRWSA